jgi:uncharacterized protein
MQRTTEQRVRAKQGEFGWVDLTASDLETQTRFYETLFGWTHEDVPAGPGQTYRLFYLDGGQVAGASQMTPEQYPSGTSSMWNTYITVDDVDAIVKTAAELGAKVIVPPMDVLSQGRTAGIEDPTGAGVFFWQSPTQGERFKVGEPGALMWNDLNTPEPDKAAEFYSKLLGWDVKLIPTQSGEPYWAIAVDGQQEGGITGTRSDFMPMSSGMFEGAAPNWRVYFGVENTAEAAEKAKAAGGQVLMEPMEVAGMTTFAVFADPGGAVFTVMERTGGM